jgi:hypothetical protein
MTNIKPDAIVYSNLTEAYLNYATTPATIAITAAVVPDTGNAAFQGSITYTRAGTRADVYLQRTDTGLKVPANAGKRISTLNPNYQVYQFRSTETVEVYIAYEATTITVTLNITNNTGASITLIPQNILMSVVQYDAPITAIP